MFHYVSQAKKWSIFAYLAVPSGIPNQQQQRFIWNAHVSVVKERMHNGIWIVSLRQSAGPILSACPVKQLSWLLLVYICSVCASKRESLVNSNRQSHTSASIRQQQHVMFHKYLVGQDYCFLMTMKEWRNGSGGGGGAAARVPWRLCNMSLKIYMTRLRNIYTA